MTSPRETPLVDCSQSLGFCCGVSVILPVRIDRQSGLGRIGAIEGLAI